MNIPLSFEANQEIGGFGQALPAELQSQLLGVTNVGSSPGLRALLNKALPGKILTKIGRGGGCYNQGPRLKSPHHADT
jgi:hypothetical protein